MTRKKREPLPGHYEAIREHLEYWRSRLLPGWTVHLMAEQARDNDGDEHPDDVDGMSQTPSPYDAMTMWVSPKLVERAQADEESWAYIEYVVVHEFLHAVFDRVGEPAEALEKMVGAVAWEFYRRERRFSEERAIDRLARALVAERRREDDSASLQRGGFLAGNDWGSE